MNLDIGRYAHKKALFAIQEAFKNDPNLSGLNVEMNGGKIGTLLSIIKFRITDNTYQAPEIVPSDSNNKLLQAGIAPPGAVIKFNGSSYKIMKARTKKYLVQELDSDKKWLVPFIGCSY